MAFKFLIFILSVAFAASFAFGADDCSTIKDVAPGLGPVENQADLSWCFAFTAADMISQKMQRLGTLKSGERIHPLQIGADYHLGQGNTPNRSIDSAGELDGVFDGVEALREGGGKICKESDLNPDTTTNNPLFKRSARASGRYFYQSLGQSKSTKDCEFTDDNVYQMQQLTDNMDAISNQVWSDEFAKKCHTAPPKGLDKRISNVDATRFSELNAANPPPASQATKEKLRKTLDEALEKGTLPAIGYRPSFMGDFSGNHASSVVARQKAGGKCFYRIRNSWGPSCNKYFDKANCGKGYIWVESEQLLSNTFLVQYIP